MLLKLDYELEISKRVIVDEGPAIESTIGASYLFGLASESAFSNKTYRNSFHRHFENVKMPPPFC